MDKPNTKNDDAEGRRNDHLPEWVQIFGELREEAEEAYPDGRVRVIIPRRRKRRAGLKQSPEVVPSR